MTKEKLLCLMIILAALAAGILIGMRIRGPNTMTMVVLNGKVYPSPSNGDVLYWISQDGNATKVKFAGPPNTGKSPCTEDEKTASSICHVKYKTSDMKMYYYDCSTCTDPGYPGPHANGGLENLGSQAPFGPTPSNSRNGGNTYHGEAYPNGQASAVYYYPPDGSSPDNFLPIPVSTYQDPRENDQIIFDPPGVSWKIVMANNQTCQEGTTFPDSNGNNTCTVLSTATPQNYCVVYQGKMSGTAVLKVNGTLPSGSAPTPTCSLP